MSNTKVVMGQASNQYVAPTMIEDVFSTYLYTGNGSTQTITNGIDLAGEGGLVWAKARSTTDGHFLFDTERGPTKRLRTHATDAETVDSTSLTSFNADGFSIGANASMNGSGTTYASWTFRKAPRFFDVVTYTGNDTGQSIPHNLGVAPGCILIKEIDGVSNWGVYHRGIGATKFLNLNATDAATTFSNVWNDTEPTDAVFTVGNETAFVNNSNHTYVAYLFAHDPLGPSGDGSDGLIACGSYTDPGAGGSVEVNLGWEPQWLLVKSATNSTIWVIMDNMRGITDSSVPRLVPNLSNAEVNVTGNYFNLTPTGFKATQTYFNAGDNVIYIAIRRGPMRQPTSGTEVFDVTTAVSNSSKVTTSFPVDFTLVTPRDGGRTYSNSFLPRLTQGALLRSHLTAAEVTNDPSAVVQFDYNDGFLTGSSGHFAVSSAASFRRAPGFFDVVAYTGDGVAGRTVPHNLGVAPEMIITKRRDAVSSLGWIVSSKYWFASTEWDRNGRLNQTNAISGGGVYEPASSHSASEYPVSSLVDVNASGGTYVAYLFATLPGVSKVGSYTGNGSSQTIDCGFTTGARFVLIKRADSTGDWYVWDTARGIVTGNDPFLELNTTDAEVTSDDSIDPDSSGFIVNQTATTNVNVSSASYIFLAIA